MQARRRAGLSNLPGTPPVGSAGRGSDPRPLCAIGCSRAQGPSAASHVRSSTLRTPVATGKSHLAHANLADRVCHALALRNQHINVPQFGDDLLRLVSSLPTPGATSSGGIGRLPTASTTRGFRLAPSLATSAVAFCPGIRCRTAGSTKPPIRRQSEKAQR
jgi:hypothetical protein